MKIVTYRSVDGAERPGVMTDDLLNVVDLSQDFNNVLALIDGGEAGLGTVCRLQSESRRSIPLASVQLLAPIPLPPQIRDFNNHPQHMRDAPQGGAKLRARLAGQPAPPPVDPASFQVPGIYLQQPIFYITNRFNIVGPDADVPRPSYSANLDYELELAFVLGRGGKDISEADAMDHIFGYTIFNDFSARDRQMVEMEGRMGPAKGKSFDRGNAIGPWIVTRDEIPHPFDLKVQVRVNGKVHGENTGRDMIHSFAKMIAFVSQDETLHPGEIFGSGTYGGCCGMEIDYYLQDGDVIELEIERIGILRNRIVPRAEARR